MGSQRKFLGEKGSSVDFFAFSKNFSRKFYVKIKHLYVKTLKNIIGIFFWDFCRKNLLDFLYVNLDLKMTKNGSKKCDFLANKAWKIKILTKFG